MHETVKYPNYFRESITGVLENNQPGPIILLVPGFCGNKEENGLFTQFAEYLARQGFNSLRFDFSGIGDSEGDFVDSSIRKQASDLNATIKYVQSRHPYNPIGLVGFSLGATVALKSQNPHVSAYSLWSPAFFPAKDMFPRYNTPENLVKLREQGYIEKNGLRIGKQLFEDLRSYDSTASLQSLVSPVQIIHGTNDSRINFQSSVDASKILRCDKRLVLIDGANHSYKDNILHREKVFEEATNWFKQLKSKTP